MPGWELMVAAYALIWAFVFGYIFWLFRRQEKLRRDVEALSGALAARDERQPGKSQALARGAKRKAGRRL